MALSMQHYLLQTKLTFVQKILKEIYPNVG